MDTTEQAAWDQRYSGPDLVWGEAPNRFVAEELAALPPGRAIDLGTGEGRNAIWLAERGWRVTAVDFSAAGLAQAARLAADRGVSVDWVQADLLVIGHDRDNIARAHGGPQDPDRALHPRDDHCGTGRARHPPRGAGAAAGAGTRGRADGDRHPGPRRAPA